MSVQVKDGVVECGVGVGGVDSHGCGEATSRAYVIGWAFREAKTRPHSSAEMCRVCAGRAA